MCLCGFDSSGSGLGPVMGSYGMFRIHRGKSFLDSVGIRWMEHKADHPHPPGAMVKNGEAIPASPNVFMHDI